MDNDKTQAHVQSENNNGKLYAAYGSNLNLAQMRRRCPTAKIVGSAILDDYRLLFRGAKENAHATIEKHMDGQVPLLIWELQETDERALDRYEGFPFYYRKEIITVELDGKPTEVMTYIMNVHEGTDGYRPLESTNPHYYAAIREGYGFAGFDLKTLEQATKDSIEPEDDIWKG